MMRQLAAAALVAVLAWTVPAGAREATEAERALLAETIATFDAATRAGDMDVVVGTIPPKVMAAISEQADLTVEELRAEIVALGKAAYEGVELISFDMDVDAARYAETTDGTPYALVPTEYVFDAGGGKIHVAVDTLALLDDGEWYLVRVAETDQIDVLKQIYPGLADITFDLGTMEAVE